jgi:hypothetical protein
VARHPLDLQVLPRSERGLDRRDELDVGLGLPALGQHAERVAGVGVEGDRCGRIDAGFPE